MHRPFEPEYGPKADPGRLYAFVASVGAAGITLLAALLTLNWRSSGPDHPVAAGPADDRLPGLPRRTAPPDAPAAHQPGGRHHDRVHHRAADAGGLAAGGDGAGRGLGGRRRGRAQDLVAHPVQRLAVHAVARRGVPGAAAVRHRPDPGPALGAERHLPGGDPAGRRRLLRRQPVPGLAGGGDLDRGAAAAARAAGVEGRAAGGRRLGGAGPADHRGDAARAVPDHAVHPGPAGLLSQRPGLRRERVAVAARPADRAAQPQSPAPPGRDHARHRRAPPEPDSPSSLYATGRVPGRVLRSRPAGSGCSCWTWTGSRKSTTPWGTPPATS